MQPANLAALHRQQAERFGPRIALRFKRHGVYQDVSWRDYNRAARTVAAALIEHGAQRGDRIGLLGENRVEWLFADMGILAAGGVNVPAHASLAGKQILTQFEHAEISWLIVSTPAQFDKVRQIRQQLPGVRGVVLMEGEAPDCLTWSRFLAQGRQALGKHEKELDRRLHLVGPEDLATIMYTSGTTGNSKGVMLTHHNLMSNALSMAGSADAREDSILLSWLPFSHIYGRLVDHYLSIAVGCTLCLAESQETLLEDIRLIQPTSISGVPRFYEKVLAYAASDSAQQDRRLREAFGSRIEWLNSGGAPLPLHVAEAYTKAGLTMLQGYGLTETSPVITFNKKESNRLGTVGLPLPGVEVKIAPDGEVLTRGSLVMKGYWKDPAATAETIKDGWLHTGDLGEIDADGYLRITGRKKDLLVLSNGKKVVPTEIEGILLKDECIDQAVVYGEGKSFLTALIVPRLDGLRAAVGKPSLTLEEAVQSPAIQELVQKRVDAALADMADWERVRKCILLDRAFSQDAGEVTVSLKLRRGVILAKHKGSLERLYAP